MKRVTNERKGRLVTIRLRGRVYFVMGLSKKVYLKGSLDQCNAFMSENFTRINNEEYDLADAEFDRYQKSIEGQQLIAIIANANRA